MTTALWRADCETTAIRYEVETYENTCRPDAATCTGCTLSTGCDYDGGAHTEPGWEQSGVLVLTR